jgi:hypothetical protein
MCPEGTQRLPEDGATCCDDFRERTAACYFDIRYEYWPDHAGWFVIIQPDAGGGGVAMNFCPHCGIKLAGKLHSGRYLEL